MAVSYEKIIRQAALRTQAFTGVGATPALLQTAYTTTPLTATQVASPDFPLAAYQDACLVIEEKIAVAVASFAEKVNGQVRRHPWARVLLSQTANVANNALIPSTDSSSNSIIGVWGSVVDATDGNICAEMALDEIRMVARNANSWLKGEVYGYAFDGNRVTHTRANVKIDVCTYNRTTQTTAISTITNSILLPDAAEGVYVDGMVSLLVRDDMFMPQAAVYAGYFAEDLSVLVRGGVPQQRVAA